MMARSHSRASSGLRRALPPSRPLPTVLPPETPPPLRVEAPYPSASASSTTARAPPRPSSMAQFSPVSPAPMMTTSALAGRSAGSSSPIRIASHQNGRALKSGWKIECISSPAAFDDQRAAHPYELGDGRGIVIHLGLADRQAERRHAAACEVDPGLEHVEEE